MPPSTAKKIPDHKDKLGRDLAVGDCVAYPSSNALFIGRVEKLNPKMLTVVKVPSKFGSKVNKYPDDVVKIDSAEVTMYLLKHT